MAIENVTRVYELQVKLAEESLRELKKLQASTETVEKQMTGLIGVAAEFGKGLVAAFSIGAITSFISKTIEATAALGDVASATGTTVEEISKLQQAARLAGKDLGTVEGLLNGLNKTLTNNDQRNRDAAAALKLLGLSLNDLRKMDPSDALRSVAVELNKFADGAGKSAAMLAITGKTASEVGGVMKELGQQTDTAAKATTKQAEESAELQRTLRQLQSTSGDTATKLALDFIPVLQRMADEFKAAREEGDGLMAIWRALKAASPATDLFKAQREMVEVTDELMSTEAELERKRASRKQSDQEQVAALEEHTKRLRTRTEELKKLLGVLRGETDAFGTPKTEAAKPDLPFRKTDRPTKDKSEEERLKMLREGNKSLVESIDLEIERERVIGLAANGNKSYTQVLEEEKKVIDELTGATAMARLDKYRQMLDDMFFDGTLSLDRYLAGLDKLHNIHTKTGDDTKELSKLLNELGNKVDGYAKKIADTLIDFVSHAGDAKFSFSDFVVSVLRDLAKMTTQLLLVEPLMESFKGWLKDISRPTPGTTGTGAKSITDIIGAAIGSLFKSNALGGVYSSSSLSRYKNGVYDKPRLFSFAQGGVFAEAGPEAVMPLTRGPDGSLGVDASGMGGDVTVNVYNETKATVETKPGRDVNGNRIIEIMVRDAVAQGFRSGAFDGVMGATYGLNRLGAR
jgi:Lambda phage tail tape-measure protein (Tape_meas_lam_C)